MADIAVTARNVRPLPGAVIRPEIAGAALNVGDVVYMASTGKVSPADASVAGTMPGIGIVVSVGSFGETAAVDGSPVSVLTYGPINGFSGMTPGVRVWVSETTGKLADVAPITVIEVMGIAIAADTILISPQL